MAMRGSRGRRIEKMRYEEDGVKLNKNLDPTTQYDPRAKFVEGPRPPRVGDIKEVEGKSFMYVNAPEKEVRVVDPVSGGEKGMKSARFSLIPTEMLWALAGHYGRGSKKYGDRNWEKGYKWSLTCDAMERHYNQFRMGETIDEETGSHHLIAAISHLVALYIFDIRKLGTDDIRPQGRGREVDPFRRDSQDDQG